MKVIKATIDHADIIGYVHSESWKQAYEDIFPLEYIKQNSTEKRKQEFLSTYENSNVQYFLLYQGENAIGVVKTVHSNKMCEISCIYLLKQYWHSGFGSKAINYIKERYNQEDIILWTLEENIQARCFYEKNGFYMTGEKREINRGKNFIQTKYQYNKECINNLEYKDLLADIPESNDWIGIKKIDKGWSADIKYQIQTRDGEKRLLRVADASLFEKKKKEYEIIQKYATLGLEMSYPKGFGVCNKGKNVYMILSWVEGEDLVTALPKLSEEEQYQLGRSAGEILRKIHSIPVEKEDVPKQTKKEKKLTQLNGYENSSLRIKNDEIAVSYVRDNIDKIWCVPPVYQHGDFHPGNLIYTPEQSVGVIDFNRWEVGDPYEEFVRLESFGIEISVPYCIGQIDAYFNDNVPKDFWTALAVYVAHTSLHSIKWAEKFGQEEIDEMVKRCEEASKHYDGFRNIIPSWYKLDRRQKENYED